MTPRPRRIDLHVHLPARTIISALFAALLVWAGLRVWPELVFLSISLLLAVALNPVVEWLGRRGVSRGLSVMALALLSLGVVLVFITVVLPPLLALTVSPVTGAIVAGSYVLYHLFETYFIVPRIYGSSLRLSTLAVLLALIIGGTLQGILGAVMVLPMVAAFPIIERIWLSAYLGRDVLADHHALARAADTARESVVDAVLQGEKHAWESVPPPRG